jgi:hypothetical protein
MRRAVLLLAFCLASCTPPPAPPPKPAGPADPWPECAEVRRRILREANDPARVEVTEWEWRKPCEDPGPPPANATQLGMADWKRRRRDFEDGAAMVKVRWREPNRFGALELREDFFSIPPQKEMSRQP